MARGPKYIYIYIYSIVAKRNEDSVLRPVLAKGLFVPDGMQRTNTRATRINNATASNHMVLYVVKE